jgi:hypothetical protein
MLGKMQAKLMAFSAFVGKVGTGATLAGAALLAPVAVLFAGMLNKAKTGQFGEDAKQSAERFSSAWVRAITALQEALLPVLTVLTPWMERLSETAKANAGIMPTIAAGAVLLIAFGLAMKLLSGVIAAAALAVGLLKIALLALSSPILLVIGGLVAMGAMATKANDWRGLFGQLGETGSKVIQGIVDAFGSGDIELAATIALSGLKVAWHDTVQWMKKILLDLMSKIGENAGKVAGGIGGGIAGFKLGARFGPIGALLGTAVGIGGGVAGGNELDKAIAAQKERLANNQGAADERAALVAALDALVLQARQQAQAPAAKIDRFPGVDTAKGLFDSSDFGRALGFGDENKALDLAKAQLEEQKKINENIKAIKPGLFK